MRLPPGAQPESPGGEGGRAGRVGRAGYLYSRAWVWGIGNNANRRVLGAGTGTGLGLARGPGRYRQDLGSWLLRPKNYNRAQIRIGDLSLPCPAPSLPCPAPSLPCPAPWHPLVDCATLFIRG